MTAITTTTCQICARAIKSGKGVIAHHGYTRPGGGWQTGSCPGARALPYEVSCDLLPPTIVRIESFIATTKTTLRNHLTKPDAQFVCQRRAPGSYGRHGATETYTLDRPADFDPKKGYHYDPYGSEWSHRKYAYGQQIEGAGRDLKFMQDRLANWKAPVA